MICFYMIGEKVNSLTANILTGSSPEVTEKILKNYSTIMFVGVLSGV